MRVLEQTRKELEDHIEVLVKDRETFDERLDTARSNKSKEVVVNIMFVVSLPMLRLLPSKAQGWKDFRKPSKPCRVGIH